MSYHITTLVQLVTMLIYCRQEQQMEEISNMYHEAIATYKRLLMETAYKATPTAAMNSQTVPDGNYGNQPVASGNQYLSSYTSASAYGQQPELSSMNMRYSPELSRRAHQPTGGMPLQQQPPHQPLPQAPPTQSISSIQLAPPAYQVSPHTTRCNKYSSTIFIRHQYKAIIPLELESECRNTI